jgi:threonine/homoserine/homoserine lactone efflux protein
LYNGDARRKDPSVLMTEATSLPLFLGSIIGISLTGVMMPGPVTAVTVAKGARRKEAGALVAIGHGVVELPLIVLLYFGLARFFEMPEVRISVGLVGGLVLFWMALSMLRIKPLDFSGPKDPPHGSILAGVITTASNPYFFLWWATVGAALLTTAQDFGGPGIAAMGVTHWLCDAAWLLLISWVVFKSKRLWTERVHRIVFGLCAAVLAGFGAWFVYSSVGLALSR